MKYKRSFFLLALAPLIAMLLAPIVGHFGSSAAVAQSSQTFRRPIDGGTIACSFDSTNCAAAGKYHTGVDYWATNGATDILASNCGVVSYIQRNGDNDHGFGNAVILKHSVIDLGTGVRLTYYTLYGHMSSLASLQIGQSVARSQKIGVMGSTGYGQPNYWGRTPHLHFEVKKSNVLHNPSGTGTYWGYTPRSAAGYGYVNPGDVVNIWKAGC